MADKRMFSKEIVLSDAFTDMSATARCLYFTLGMVADDDGFVGSVKSAIRQCRAKDKDLQELIDKRFVLMFDSGVVAIKHWQINNYIRSDRYKETSYIEEKEALDVKQNGAYTPKNDAWYTSGIPDGIPRLEENRLDKNSNTYTAKFEQFWKAYPKKVGKKDAEKAFNKIKPSQDLVDTMVSVINRAKETEQWTKDGCRYIPNPSTWLNQGRWEDDIESYGYKTSAEGRKVENDRFASINY